MLNIKVRGAEAIAAMRDGGLMGGAKAKGAAGAGKVILMGSAPLGVQHQGMMGVAPMGHVMMPVGSGVQPGMQMLATPVNADVVRQGAGGLQVNADIVREGGRRGAEMEAGRGGAVKVGKGGAAAKGAGAKGAGAAACKKGGAMKMVAGVAPGQGAGAAKVAVASGASANLPLVAPKVAVAASQVAAPVAAGAATATKAAAAGTIWNGTGMSLGLGLGLGALGPVLALSALGLCATGIYMYGQRAVLDSTPHAH